jgi:hypothetical protein
MEILRDPILNYARIISKKYKIPLKKIKPLIDSSWTFKITGEIIKEPLYVDDKGDKYIIIDNNTGIKLLY